jgi:rare lipoprotein A (peptidoglycan hydrolase)
MEAMRKVQWTSRRDQGPIAPRPRVGDVSVAAAQRLGMVKSGVIDAELAVVSTPAARTR